MWTFAFLLLLAPEPATTKTWTLLFADEKGGYWVDAETGTVDYDPALARKPRKPAAPDPRSQLREPPPMRRYRDRTVTTAKGVTVRLLKNRLRLERDGKKSWLDEKPFVRDPVLRPDGKVLAYLRWDGKSRMGGKAPIEDLVLLDLEKNESTVLLEKKSLHGFAWSPDGARLAIGLIGEVVLVDAGTRKNLRTWRTVDVDERLWNHAPTGLVFHPDGKWIATRCVFVGGREAGTEIFGDHHLLLLSTEKTRVIDLPKTTCEGPIRGKVAETKEADDR